MEPHLIDPFQRRIEYLRLSVTDRCDLRCSYCLPKGFKDFEEPDHWLSFDEIERVLRAFAALGVRRVRLTGGEPLVRAGLARLAERLTRLPGIDDLSLSTNATRLAKLAAPLKQAGVTRINISLDSLRPERFRAITGGGKLDKVLAGLDAAQAAGFQPIKINMVAMKGVNDDEIADMVAFCIERDFTLRLIETMPMGATGLKASEHYLDLQTVKHELAKRYELIPTVMAGGRSQHPASRDTDTSVYGGGPARYFQVAGTRLKIGFITPISQHFCATCNRVRLTADGTLYTCLGQDSKTELRPLLRSGISEDELQRTILAAIARKPEQHEFREKPEQVVRFMSVTGG
ncbi:MAG: GTP 3',8-cyclase MoaA [Gammaproteobacteria bacterium]|nr:GTP 3',8-cyclase MoaA [Gammaproteobacteria bacterium]